MKNEYGLTPLRVRGLQRVALHADLTMLARLGLALARARSGSARRIELAPQSNAVSHGCPPVRVRRVNVINTGRGG